jgi:hypothetical protein
MTKTRLDRPLRPAPPDRLDRQLATVEKGSALGLPVVVLPLGPRRPAGFVPQGSDGSVLIPLDSLDHPLDAAPQSPEIGVGETALQVFEASRRQWIEVRIPRERSSHGGHISMPREGERRPAVGGAATGVEFPWTFEVPEHEEGRRVARNTTRSSPAGLEMDPLSGFFHLTDAEGHRSSVVRLRSKRPRRRSGLELSLLLEILRAKGTAGNPPLRPSNGTRPAAEWVTVASLESNARWLFVSIETHGVSFALRSAPERALR